MKRILAIFCVLALAGCGTLVPDGDRDCLWGKWEDKTNPKTFFVFGPTNIVASISGMDEVWQVVGGTNLVLGLTVTRAGQQAEAKSIVKFNEMIFHLGQRTWLLNKAGSKSPDFGGELPNPEGR